MGNTFDNAFTEPSGIVVTSSDRLNVAFSDVSLIHQGAYFFIARGLRYGKWFAIKGINAALQADEGLKTLLYKEFELLVGLNHPNIRKVLSLEKIEGYGECMVMEFTEGYNLHQWLQQPRNLSARIRVACEVADAVDYIHKKGTVHRDIKPDNIIITHIGESAKLIDFGLSDSDDYAVYKHPAGTPEYTSPEQATSAIPETGNDIYSLGVLLKSLLPEKRFKPLIKECTAPAEKRPRSASYIKERIVKLSKGRRNLLAAVSFSSLVIILALVALFLFFGRSETQENPENPAELAGAIPAEESEAPLQDELAYEAEFTEPLRMPSAALPADGALPDKKADAAQAPYSAERSVEIFLNEGKNSMDKAAAAIKESKKKSDPQSAGVWSEEDYEMMRKVKESYIANLKFLIENSPAFSESYIFGKEELTKVDNGLENELKKYFAEETGH